MDSITKFSETQRKVWSSPQLIILQRRKPEESVLTLCKNDGGMSGPQEYFSGCFDFDEETADCGAYCADIAPS
jgi:hypothetical protein